MSAEKRFDAPVTISLKDGEHRIETVNEALLVLQDVDWPGPRDDLHTDACDTCLKVLDGHRSTVDARDRFVEAGRAAGIVR